MFDACMMRWSRYCIICLSISAAIYIAAAYSAETTRIAVVYPEVGKPYQDVIDSIVEGIRHGSSSSLEMFAIKEGDGGLNAWLLERKIKVVIALGKQGLEATNKLPNGTQRILGALLSPPPKNEASYSGGISLVPDPEIVFEKIQELSLKVRRVIVVYDPATNDWLIQQAKQTAIKNSLELNALPANDLREAANAYAQLQQKGLNETDLVWLLNDPNTVDQNTILPLLLKTSWSDGFIVISNNPGHVKRGVLFALYPDYIRMGESLGKLASQVAANGQNNKSLSPLKDVLIAVNLRTAEHLNLAFSQKEVDAFNLVFPESR